MSKFVLIYEVEEQGFMGLATRKIFNTMEEVEAYVKEHTMGWRFLRVFKEVPWPKE